MGKLVAVIGSSGVGKTFLVKALARTGDFTTAFEQHEERPFQAAFKRDARYGLANQVDFFLLRAGQEYKLRASPKTGLVDGGLDLDFHGFTRLFYERHLLSGQDFELCRQLYGALRGLLPMPELLVRLRTDQATVAARLYGRERINIASARDFALFESFLDEWLATVPAHQVLEIDVSQETLDIDRIKTEIVAKVSNVRG